VTTPIEACAALPSDRGSDRYIGKYWWLILPMIVIF